MRLLSGFLVIAASSVLIGCGGSAGVDGLVPASGTVTYQGQPVPSATVVFVPQGEGRASSATTDTEGRFTLTTLSSGDGILPGKYQVSVSKTVLEGDMPHEEALAYAEKHGEPPTVTKKELLPERYKTPATSQLTADVTEDGENDFTFALAD